MSDVPDHAQDGFNPQRAGNVLDWSDKYKIARLQAENATLKIRAVEREQLIAQQARTIGSLFLRLNEIGALAEQASTLITDPPKGGKS